MLKTDADGRGSDGPDSTRSSHRGPGPTWRRVDIKQTLRKPKQPPLIVPATPPHWEREAKDSGAIFLDDGRSPGDFLVQPEPAYEFDGV